MFQVICFQINILLIKFSWRIRKLYFRITFSFQNRIFNKMQTIILVTLQFKLQIIERHLKSEKAIKTTCNWLWKFFRYAQNFKHRISKKNYCSGGHRFNYMTLFKIKKNTQLLYTLILFFYLFSHKIKDTVFSKVYEDVFQSCFLSWVFKLKRSIWFKKMYPKIEFILLELILTLWYT